MTKRLLPLLALIGVVVTGPAFAQSPYLGEIRTFAFTFCPVGWAPLDGTVIAINSNTALFSLLGTDFGGDGTSTFALPVARPIFSATGVQYTQCIATSGIFPPIN